MSQHFDFDIILRLQSLESGIKLVEAHMERDRAKAQNDLMQLENKFKGELEKMKADKEAFETKVMASVERMVEVKLNDAINSFSLPKNTFKTPSKVALPTFNLILSTIPIEERQKIVRKYKPFRTNNLKSASNFNPPTYIAWTGGEVTPEIISKDFGLFLNSRPELRSKWTDCVNEFLMFDPEKEIADEHWKRGFAVCKIAWDHDLSQEDFEVLWRRLAGRLYNHANNTVTDLTGDELPGGTQQLPPEPEIPTFGNLQNQNALVDTSGYLPPASSLDELEALHAIGTRTIADTPSRVVGSAPSRVMDSTPSRVVGSIPSSLEPSSSLGLLEALPMATTTSSSMERPETSTLSAKKTKTTTSTNKTALKRTTKKKT